MLYAIINAVDKKHKADLVLEHRKNDCIIVYYGVGDLVDELAEEFVSPGSKIIKAGDRALPGVGLGNLKNVVLHIRGNKGRSNGRRPLKSMAQYIKEPDEVIVDEFEWGEEGREVEGPKFSFEINFVEFVDSCAAFHSASDSNRLSMS